MTAINATVCANAAGSINGLPIFGDSGIVPPKISANSGIGPNPTPDQGTPPLVGSRGLGMTNQVNPTTAAFEAGTKSFADSNKFDKGTANITPVPLNDGGYTLGPNGPGVQEKQGRQPQGGAQFESAAPAAAVPPMVSGPGAVYVESADPVKGNPKTVNAEF
jgi:hypothetical protein